MRAAGRLIGSRWWWLFWFAWCIGFGIFDAVNHVWWAVIVMAVELAIFMVLAQLLPRLLQGGRV